MSADPHTRKHRFVSITLSTVAVLGAATAIATVVTGTPAFASAAAFGHPLGANLTPPWASYGWQAGSAGSAMGHGASGGWWAGPGGGAWAHTGNAHTEYFYVVSTKPGGPGTIIVTGPINAGGSENPGRAVDQATFNGGSFRINHSVGKPTTHFDTATCVGTIIQTGPFQVIDATGTMSALAGSGHYTFRAIYTTTSSGGHCTSTMTGYEETIDGVARVAGP